MSHLLKKVCIIVYICSFSMQVLPEESMVDNLSNLSFEELLNVKITTASKFSQKVVDTPASTVVITRQEIQSFGYSSIAEMLEAVSGLYQINNYGDDSPNFGVRGYWSGVSRNMILMINGIRQNYDILSSYSLSRIAIPVEAIERVEVVKGPTSVIYGSGAFFGAINIITRDQENANPISMVAISGNNNGGNKIFIRTNQQLDNFTFDINASLSKSDGIDEPFASMMNDPSLLTDAFNLPIDARTKNRLNENSRFLNFSARMDEFLLEFNYTKTGNESMFLFPAFSKGSEIVFVARDLFFKYQSKLTDNISFDGQIGFFDDALEADYDILSADFIGNEESSSKGYEVDLIANIEISPTFRFLLGFNHLTVKDGYDHFALPSFEITSLLNTKQSLGGDSIITNAAFSQLEFNPNEELQIFAGLRLQQLKKYHLQTIYCLGTDDQTTLSGIFDKDDLELIPNVAIIYKLNELNILKFLYGKGVNHPSFFQNVQTVLRVPEIENLESEEIKTFELNYVSSLLSDITLEASIFHNELDNLIVRKSELINETYDTFSANFGNISTKGVEVTIKGKTSGSLFFDISGMYQNSNDKRLGFNNIDIAYSPEFIGKFKLSYPFQSGVIASITGNYVSEMNTFWDDTLSNSDGSTGGRIGNKADSYAFFTFNLHVSDFIKKGLFFNFRVTNILNKEIRYPTYTNNSWATKGTIGKDRRIVATIGYEFH